MNLNFINEDKRTFTATRNACRLCAPLGASLAFRGIEGCIPLIHGSQGCSTYIRRYIISHFREPMDIASSNFTEASAVFGGRENLHLALNNIIMQYRPKVIGIASTCLSETIGDDVEMFLSEYRNRADGNLVPPIVYASTPSYQGSHIEGYFTAVTSAVKSLVQKTSGNSRINIIPGFISSDDIRHLKEIVNDMGVEATVFPDYSETMDGEAWDEYIKLSPGGTTLESILLMGSAVSTIQLGGIYQAESAAEYLENKFKTENMIMGIPMGIDETDKFFSLIKKSTGKDIPVKYTKERGRLADSYIDAHKYVFGKRAVLAGDEDMVTGLAHLCLEVGIVPVLCATGSGNNSFKNTLESMFSCLSEKPLIISASDYADILDQSRCLEPDLVIGPSKGYYVSRALGVPLVRTGFPVHDRIGGQRLLHVGYRGTQRIFDAIVNALLEHKQNASTVGYSYQ